MVVWVFAGGGEAEVRGLIPFLEKNFPGCRFERKTPINKKPGPKPNKAASYGRTGRSLIAQIKEQLPIALEKEPNICQLILVFDDLDCRDPRQQEQKILDAIDNIPNCSQIHKFVGFAAPELEAWLIADWANSVAQHPDFSKSHKGMRWWLSTQRNVCFDTPESFSQYDSSRDSCIDKLSDALIESSVQQETHLNKPRYSKALHTPVLLLTIDPNVVQQKCPIFRKLYNYLRQDCHT